MTRTRSPSYPVVDVFTEPLSGNSLAVLPEASEFDAAGETIVVILADTGERYISTRLFAEGMPKTYSNDRAESPTLRRCRRLETCSDA